MQSNGGLAKRVKVVSQGSHSRNTNRSYDSGKRGWLLFLLEFCEHAPDTHALYEEVKALIREDVLAEWLGLAEQIKNNERKVSVWLTSALYPGAGWPIRSDVLPEPAGLC